MTAVIVDRTNAYYVGITYSMWYIDEGGNATRHRHPLFDVDYRLAHVFGSVGSAELARAKLTRWFSPDGLQAEPFLAVVS